MSEAAKTMLPDSRICANCGKEFTVLFPDMWRYRARIRDKMEYMCSWRCLRENEEKQIRKVKRKETKGEEELENGTHRDQKEVAIQMLAAMDAGEEPRVFLKKIGYANPTDQITKLRRWAEKNDKKIAEKLKAIPAPKRGPQKKPVVKVVKAKKLPEEARMPKKAEELQTKVADPPEVIENIDVPIVPENFTVTNIESKTTTARYSFYKDINVFTLKMGMDQISLSPEDWKKLLAEIPKAMETLGVTT